MMLTPVDIELKEFKRARIGGYQVDDVNEFLDEVIKSFEEVHRENIELKDKIILLNESISYYKSMESTLQNTLILAEKTAQETKSLAYQKSEQIVLDGTLKADQMIQDARHEVYEITQNIHHLKKQYESTKIQIKKILESQMEILENQTITTQEVPKSPEKTEYYTKEYQIINEEEDVI